MAYTPKEIPTPDYNVPPPEKIQGLVNHSDGVMYFDGRGNKKNPRVVFVSPCPLEEEGETYHSRSPAMLLKGGPGELFKRSALKAGIKLEDHYYTTLCKYCLPKKKKLKPTAEDIKRCSILFEKELKRRKPEVVVCLGKAVFDYFYDLRFQEREIKGGWFEAPEHTIKVPTGEVEVDVGEDGEDDVVTPVTKDFECYRDFKLFVMGPIHVPYSHPEALESQFYDLKELQSHLLYSDSDEYKVETNYELLDSLDTVRAWRDKALEYSVFSVDCEWAGEDYLSGDLRSVQMCWEAGQAACLQFFNEDGVRTFTDEEYTEVLTLFQEVMNRPHVRFIGHNFSADYLWLKHWLGVDPYKRCIFDTMYGMQTVDEYYDLKLERLSIRFTDLGRYDIDLLIWKKGNKDKMKDGGYGAVPTEILFPYSCADVDVPFRAWHKLTKHLSQDGTLRFYHSLKLPFVTDGYAHMTETGIPLDKDDARRVRQSFTMISCFLLEDFKRRVKDAADQRLLSELVRRVEDMASVGLYQDLLAGDAGREELKQLLGAKQYAEVYNVFMHWEDARDFNPNSSAQKIRWLFDFKGFRPVKSTSMDGNPSVSWDKVEALPESRQREYTPSTDKEVLQIYAEKDDDVQLLLEHLAVNQIIKNFLKSENTGLEGFLRNDGRVHTSLLATETGRPKSVRPNILNIPAYLAKRVTTGFERAKKSVCGLYAEEDIHAAYKKFKEDYDGGFEQELPDEYMEPVPLRWCFKAPPGWCFVDADYATAEVFALAYLANDKKLINALTQPDPQFVLVQGPDDKEPTPVRVAFSEGVTQFDESEWDQDLVHDLEALEHVLRDDNGEPKRPLRDVHWEMAENRLFMNKPREKLKKAVHRNGGGKVGNFSVPYQSSPGLLKRMIELATGQKQADDIGEKLIAAYAEGKPDAWQFLMDTMERVANEGFYQGPSGVKRHFHTHQANSDIVGEWKQKGVMTGVMREASNFPMQNLVADTLARAVVMLVDAFRKEGLKAGVACPLYDALYIVCPISERTRVQELMQQCMSDNNYWDLPGGRLAFNLDFETTLRWSCKPTDAERAQLEDINK